MKKILVRNLPDSIPNLHSHPLLNQIYAARGVTSSKDLDYDFANLLPYEQLVGIQPAVACLCQALQEQQRIVVIGDFDADGATSTALAVLALKSFGCKNISYLIPNRFKFGYGLTPEIVAVAAEQRPHLIITVDNGIASIEGVLAANNLGIKVIVTDHHLPGTELPAAVAIVNPNQPGDNFASKHLAGVGVIFYLLLALRSKLRESNWFVAQQISEPNLAQFLDLVALGTVADVVVLDKINRLLVAQGIARIRAGKCRAGIKELFAVTKRTHERALASDLGFVIAPRLNAAGRLDEMSLGVECLLSEDVVATRTMAKQLDGLNNERREIEGTMQQQAIRALDNLQLEQELPLGLCVYEETWHQGVLGILAARLKDKLHRPVIAFAAISATEIKGSARSIAGLHIRDILNDIAVQHPTLITKFGGHAMAAGLSLLRENYEQFAQVFAATVAKQIDQCEQRGMIYTDGILPREFFTLETAELIKQGGPWGQNFPEPTFHGTFSLVEQRIVGQKHLKIKVQHLETLQVFDAICFNVDTKIWPDLRRNQVEIVYRLDVNEYNGRKSLQLLVECI